MQTEITHAAHTPGLMTFREDGDANRYSMVGADGRWWLALLHNGEATSPRQIANMRRLAAAWNACEGIGTEELERMGAGSISQMRQTTSAPQVPVVVVDLDCGAIHNVRATVPVRVILIDADTESADDASLIAEIEGSERYVSDWNADDTAPAEVLEVLRVADLIGARNAQAGYTWRRTPAGALVLANAEGADIANVYRVPSGKVCADPWGRERRHFEGPTAEADAQRYVEATFR